MSSSSVAPGKYDMYLDGKWAPGAQTMPVYNPATEEVIANVPSATGDEVQSALESAAKAQRAWSRLTGVERGKHLRSWADLVDRDRERLARVISEEEGKPLAEALGEVDFGNSWFRYYAEFDRRIEGEILPADRPNEQIWITRSPVGVVVGIIPWNYPLAVAIRKIAPALICGNSIVLKPHEDTPLSAIELARLAEEAGLPPGVLNVITGPGETTGEALVTSAIPGLISFTGSVPTGKRIMRNAAEHVTAVSLELGGKAPFIVMDDSDLDTAVKTAVQARFFNCGQVCICNERTYVHKRIAAEFIDAFVSEARKLKIGNPLEAENTIGPKVSRGELDKVEKYVDEAVREGARLLMGGKRPVGDQYKRGHWYEPTVLVDVKQRMRIMQEEVFGPVVPIMEFSGFDEAIALANDSKYGLAAYLFTKDMDRVLTAVRDMECGELYVNRGPGESIHGFHTGWKQSGLGGDDGKHGLDHYLQRKTVYIRFQG